jgi:hypothetical protein
VIASFASDGDRVFRVDIKRSVSCSNLDLTFREMGAKDSTGRTRTAEIIARNVILLGEHNGSYVQV